MALGGMSLGVSLLDVRVTQGLSRVYDGLFWLQDAEKQWLGVTVVKRRHNCLALTTPRLIDARDRWARPSPTRNETADSVSHLQCIPYRIPVASRPAHSPLDSHCLRDWPTCPNSLRLHILWAGVSNSYPTDCSLALSLWSRQVSGPS